MDRCLISLFDRDLVTNPLSPEEALGLFELQGDRIHVLLAAAALVRERHLGRRVSLCAIVNAKSGRCPENCAFCAQSAHHDTGVESFPLLSAVELANVAGSAADAGATRFSVVTSGKSVSRREELAAIKDAFACFGKAANISPCASLGILPVEVLAELKSAGLMRYHHNLETSRSFFPKICSTHDYEEDTACVRAAREMGLEVCCGGILGLGESRADRVELVFTLKELDVDAVPLNFLNPIPGTPLGDRPLLEPLEALKAVAVFRLVLPTKEIVIAGGRQVVLRDLQAHLFTSGASGLMIGNYLTTKGRSPADDLRMLRDLGLDVGQG